MIAENQGVARRGALCAVLLAATAYGGAGESTADAGGAGATTAAADDWDATVAAATDEGEVTIYSSQVDSQLEALKVAFEEEHPDITLNIVRQDDGSLLPRVEAESRTGRGTADIFVSASLPWITENGDLFVAPVGPSFEGGEYDAEVNVPDGTYFVISAFVGAYGWNTDLYPGPIEDWPDMLDPELAEGRIGIVNPDTPSKVAFYFNLEDNYGAEFLEQLAEQEPRVYPSVQPMVGALTSGEIAVATFIDPLIDEQEAGAPVEWSLGGHPWGTRFHAMILETGPNPNAAQVLADFLVTRPAQEAIAQGAAAVLGDVDGAVTSIDNVAEQDVERVSPENLQAFQARWDELFN